MTEEPAADQVAATMGLANKLAASDLICRAGVERAQATAQR